MIEFLPQLQNCFLVVPYFPFSLSRIILQFLTDDSNFLQMCILFLLNKFLKQHDGLFLPQEFLLVLTSSFAVAVHLKQQQMNRQIQQVINFAKIAEQTQRYEDMVKYVRDIIKINKNQKLAVQEEQIKLFSTAYKCKINSRRTAWRALEILYSKEVNSKNRSSAIIQYYKDNIEKEIRQICQESISTVDSILKGEKLKLSIKLELYKMRGDFHRYLCEISKDQDELKRLQKESESTYKKGIEELKAEEKKEKQTKDKKDNSEYVSTYDARRLAIYLNLSVFYYEVMNQVPKAIETCEQGFNSALENISNLQEAKYIDSVTIMQLMHDNITAWKGQKDKK